MRSLLLALLFALMASAAHAQKWSNFITVSATSTLVTNTLCYNDGRDLACDSAAGLLVTSGTVAFGNISTTNISVSTINGQAAGSLGVSKLASLTDVSETGVSSGMLLRYNGSKWESVGASTALSTTTMIPNWPDSIRCTQSGVFDLYLVHLGTNLSTNLHTYRAAGGTIVDMTYNPDGSYNSNSNGSVYDCATSSLSISQLYALGHAYNFIGSGLTSAASPNNGLQYSNNGGLAADTNLQWISSTAVVSVTGTVSATYDYSKYVSTTSLWVNGQQITGSSSGDRIVSGSLTAIANSATGYISLTTGATNWGYLSSAVNYLPTLRTNTLSATTAIQVGTNSLTCSTSISGTMRYSSVSTTMEYCNGSAWVSMGPSATTPVSFWVDKGGTNQTSVSTGNQITWSNIHFDTNNNFASNKYTVTVPGVYLFYAQIRCTSNASCLAEIRKNGTATVRGGIVGAASSSSYYGQATAVLNMAAGDYVDVDPFLNSSPDTVQGAALDSYFSGVLLAPQGGGSGGATPAGSSNDIQFNSSGALAADTGKFTYATATGTLSVTTVSSSQVTVAGNVSAATVTVTANSTTCSASNVGTFRRNPTTNRVEICE